MTLPNEVVLLALNYINCRDDQNQCSLVNKNFYMIMNPLLWREPLYPFEDTRFSALADCFRMTREHPDGERRSFCIGQLIHTLSIPEESSIEDLFTILKYTTSVKVLTICLELQDEDMTRVFQHLPQLSSLYICVSEPITDECMVSLAHYCPQLVNLTLTSCDKLTPKAIMHLESLKLKELNLSNCRWAVEDETAKYISRFDHLTHFTQYQNALYPSIGANYIRALLPTTKKPKPVPLLVDVKLGNCLGSSVVDNSVLLPFFKSHPLIESLSMNEAEIDEDTFIGMAKYLPKLKVLDLRDCATVSSQMVRQFIKISPNLSTIQLKGCELPTRCFPECRSRDRLVKELNSDAISLIRTNNDLQLGPEDDVINWDEIGSDDDSCVIQ